MASLAAIKRREIKAQLDLLVQQYRSVSKQLRHELGAANKVTLKTQLADLERQMAAAEQELQALQSNATGESPETGDTVDKTELLDRLRRHFNMTELRTLSFRLGINHEEIDRNEGQTAMARELIDYCIRHERLDELVALVNRLRPDIRD